MSGIQGEPAPQKLVNADALLRFLGELPAKHYKLFEEDLNRICARIGAETIETKDPIRTTFEVVEGRLVATLHFDDGSIFQLAGRQRADGLMGWVGLIPPGIVPARRWMPEAA